MYFYLRCRSGVGKFQGWWARGIPHTFALTTALTDEKCIFTWDAGVGWANFEGDELEESLTHSLCPRHSHWQTRNTWIKRQEWAIFEGLALYKILSRSFRPPQCQTRISQIKMQEWAISRVWRCRNPHTFALTTALIHENCFIWDAGVGNPWRPRARGSSGLREEYGGAHRQGGFRTRFECVQPFCLVWITKAYNLGWPLNLWERVKLQNKLTSKLYIQRIQCVYNACIIT